MARKRLEIVFQETDGPGFKVFLQGVDKKRMEAIDKMSPEEQLQTLSPAEFWALRCFQIAMHTLQQSGVVATVDKKPDES